MLRIPLGVVFLATALGAQQWIEKDVFYPQYEPVIAFDEARQRAVAFHEGQTWEWDGQRWFRRYPANSPVARTRHVAMWDPVRSRVIVFGGIAEGPTALQDTWEWDGTDWQEVLTTNAPNPVFGRAAMVWDPIRGEGIYFDGQTWRWRDGDWSFEFSASRPHGDSSLAWDGNLGGILAYGNEPSGRTWLWDGSSWTQLTPANEPVATDYTSMAWDPARNRVLLFGGRQNFPVSIGNLNETYRWNGINWVKVNTSPQPAQRESSAMWFDPITGDMMLFGGQNAPTSTPFGDLWGWNGTQWSRRQQQVTPTTRNNAFYQAAAAYDAARDNVVLVLASPPETWTWDGAHWSQGISSPGSIVGVMAYDEARAECVLFGSGPSTWTWGGTAWSRRFPVTSPVSRVGSAMAYDNSRDVAVLFGGRPASSTLSLGDTWEWNGSDWTEQSPIGETPPARYGHAMAFDASRGVTVLFGGRSSSTGSATLFDDTWEWNGSGWTQITPTVRPPARHNANMAYDSVHQRIVLAGGSTLMFERMADQWTWDGANWVQVTASTAIGKRSEGFMVFDSARNRLVVHGGVVGEPFTGTPLTGTWEYGATTAASFATTGTACAGAITPSLEPRGLPTLGNDGFGIELVNGAPLAAGLIGVAASNSPVPLGPCVFYLGAPLVTVPVLTTSVGSASIDVPIPLIAGLSSVTLTGQGFVTDGTAPLGVSFTAALGLTIGE